MNILFETLKLKKNILLKIQLHKLKLRSERWPVKNAACLSADKGAAKALSEGSHFFDLTFLPTFFV